MIKHYLSENEELMKEWDFEGNANFDPNTITLDYDKKVWWVCDKCGFKWKTSVKNRAIRKRGCLNCTNQVAFSGVNDLETLHPEIAKEWHPTKNGDLTPKEIRPNSNKKYWWICSKCGHEWLASGNSRVRLNSGCPACAGRVSRQGINDIFTICPELKNEWYFELNNKFDPSILPIGSHTKVWWKCSKCGYKWQDEIRRRIKGSRCPCCTDKVVIMGKNDLVTLYPEVAKEWHPTKNGNILPQNIRPNSNKKYWWRCSKCGYEWQTSIKNRVLKKVKCHYCETHKEVENNLEITHPDILLDWDFNKNGDYKPNYFTKGSSFIAWWKCNKCGRETQKSIHNYNGCSICNRISKLKNEKILSSNIFLMKEWDFKANKDLDPNLLTIGSNKKVYWICSKCGHEWMSTIYHRATRGHSCPNCRYGSRSKKEIKALSETHPEIAVNWNYEKNGNLTPNVFTKGSSYRIWWKCKECGHEWEQSIDHYKGCSNCKRKAILDEKSLAKLYPELTKEWHPTKNGDLYPFDITYAANKKVWWKCHKCGYEWYAKISNRTMLNRGCPCCSGQITVIGVNDLLTTHPEIAKEWHPTKNKSLTPNSISKGTRRKVWWLCPQGHEYQATVNHRTNKDGTNCPICQAGRQTSFAEQAFYYYLKQLYPDAINRFKADFLGKMELDIYIPSTHVAIEYDGEAWHKKEKVDRERKKYQICKEQEIYLIRLKEKDYTGEKNADECFVFPDLYRAKKLDYIIPKLLNKLDTKIVDVYNRNNDWIKNYDVNIERDRIKILSCFATQHKKDSFAEKYPEIAKEWHPTRNESLTPYMFKPHSGHKVWWKCSECGYEYETTIGSRTSGSGCIKCSTKRSAEKRGRVVYMIDPITNKVIRKFNTISDVKKELNINISNISTVCKGERSKAGGYIWKYEEDLYDEKGQLCFEYE